MARMPGGFNLFGYTHDTREDYPEDASRVVTSVPADEDSFYPDSDVFPGAVRTVREGQPLDFLSGLEGLEDDLEEALHPGLPADVRKGLQPTPDPVEVKVTGTPGGDAGRVVKMLVPNMPADNGPSATRLFTANPNRRSVLLYNDGAGAVFWGYTESEARGGVAGNGFPLPVGGSLVLDTSKELWFSTDTVAGVYIRTATVGTT